ncbi:MAG: hypothetical protein KIT11_02230 [Fimbriimonadaceae bacterium]|nr:hypothetical protein [Fimbriimonadaceae bacterium]QYK54814.1 MAG: hypothetical protein KF733_07305 [Fimbriimonadaceae bacterium]
MRLLLVWVLLASMALAQSPDPALQPPQAIVTVWKHATGADMVQVSMVSSAYPGETLRNICLAMGRELGSEPRGLAVTRDKLTADLSATKARFAVDGLIDRQSGELRLQPVVRAFLGVPAPFQVSTVLVNFDGEKPVDGVTLKDYESDTVVLKATYSEAPLGIEYRVVALVQDPAALKIPARFQEPQIRQKASKKGAAPPTTLLVGLAGVSALAAVGLVYFALANRARRRLSARPGRTGRPHA